MLDATEESESEFTFRCHVRSVAIYNTSDDILTRKRRYGVYFVDDGKVRSVRAARPPIVSLSYPEDTTEGYRQLGLLFDQAAMRNIERDKLFAGISNAGICIGGEGTERFFAGIKVELRELHYGLFRELRRRLGSPNQEYYDKLLTEINAAAEVEAVKDRAVDATIHGDDWQRRFKKR